MKKLFFSVLISTLISLGLSADYTATIAEFSGKVEIKNQGSSKWEKAAVGMVVKSGTTVSVGLKSSALLKLGENKINVKSLTRLTLKELVEKEGKLTTDIYLDTGKVSVDVAKIEGKKQEFKVGSPVATASVRGTGFDFDGVFLDVFHGEVDMQSWNGVSIPVAAGESAELDPYSYFSDFTDALESFYYDTSDSSDLFEYFSDLPDDLAGFFDDFFDTEDFLDYLYGGGFNTLSITIE
jgi:uncharacterized cupredoxin-like copper-binding protein